MSGIFFGDRQDFTREYWDAVDGLPPREDNEIQPEWECEEEEE